MTIENQRNKKNTHLGEALDKYLPPLTLEKFTNREGANYSIIFCNNKFLNSSTAIVAGL